MKTTGSIINTPFDDLSERISVVYFVKVRNERGDILKIEAKKRCEIWAKVYPLTARSVERTPEQTNVVNYRVTIRYRDDIKSDDEVVWRGRRLKLISPLYDAESRKIYTVFDCEEVVWDEQT